jgi:hypothetical protein
VISVDPIKPLQGTAPTSEQLRASSCGRPFQIGATQLGFDFIGARRWTPERDKEVVHDSNSSFDHTDGPSMAGMITIGMAGLASLTESRGATADALVSQSDFGTMPPQRTMNVQSGQSYAI